MWTARPPTSRTGMTSDGTELPTITNSVGSMPCRPSTSRYACVSLFGHDLDAPEVVGQSAAVHLAALVGEVALGYEQQSMVVGQGSDCRGDVRKQCDRGVEHLSAPLEHLGDVCGLDRSVGDCDGGFDHRQHEALHAVAGDRYVCPFGVEQDRLGGGAVGPGCHEFDESPFGLPEVDLVLPEGVVGVEPQYGKVVHPGEPRRWPWCRLVGGHGHPPTRTDQQPHVPVPCPHSSPGV